MRILIFILDLTLILIFAKPNIAGEFLDNTPTLEITNDVVHGMSGIIPAHKTYEYWGINDHFPYIFRFDLQGNILQVVHLNGLPDEDAPNLYKPERIKQLGLEGRPEKMDWEGMAKDDEGNIYIADFGDNRSQRKYIQIHILSPLAENIDKTTNFKTFDVCYPDQKPRNCEAVFYMNCKIYIITKVETNSQNSKEQEIFCLDACVEGETNYLRKIGEINIPSVVTGASYSSQNKKLAVMTYDGIGIYDVEKESDLLNPITHFIYAVLGQSEAICFDGDDLVMTNEPGRIWKHPLANILKNHYFMSSIPRLKIRRSHNDPIIDGNIDDWLNSASLVMQQGYKGSDHVIRETNDREKRDVNILLTDKGLYISFEFTKKSPNPGSSKDDWMCDRFIVMLSTESSALLASPQNPIYSVYFPKEQKGKEARVVNNSNQIVGLAKGKPLGNSMLVEVLIETKYLPVKSMAVGHEIRFNVCLIEPVDYIRSKGWSWAGQTFRWNQPFSWGILEFIE